LPNFRRIFAEFSPNEWLFTLGNFFNYSSGTNSWCTLLQKLHMYAFFKKWIGPIFYKQSGHPGQTRYVPTLDDNVPNESFLKWAKVFRSCDQCCKSRQMTKPNRAHIEPNWGKLVLQQNNVDVCYCFTPTWNVTDDFSFEQNFCKTFTISQHLRHLGTCVHMCSKVFFYLH
jgi:hypothetical protein